MEEAIIDLYKKLQNGNLVAKQLNISHGKVYNVLNKRGIPKRKQGIWARRYPLNEHYFDKIDDQNKAYFLGFLYADGCNRTKLTTLKLQAKDKEILEKLNRLINENRPLSHIKNVTYTDQKGAKHKCQDAYQINIGSTYVCDQLRNWGVVERKTDKLIFPQFLTDDLIAHFIRGYFDGDGSIYITFPRKNKTPSFHVNFSTKTLNFAEGLKEKIETILNIKTYLRKGKNIYTLHISSHQSVYKFCDFIYKDSNLFLRRKFDKFVLLKQYLTS
jgi:hypothetical protein